MPNKNFKETQQDLTELNSDGNRDRGRYGEDLSKEETPDISLTEKEEELLKKKLEQMRKRDPFIYR